MEKLIDPEAELQALGSMMIKEDIAAETISRLTSNDFYDPAHRDIFTAAVETFMDGNSVNIVTVSDQARRSGINVSASIIAATTNNIIPSRSYASVVKRLSRSRSFLSDLKRMTHEVESGMNIDQIVGDFSSSIVSAAGAGSRLSAHGDSISSTIDQIRERSASKLKLAGIPSDFVDLDSYTSGLVKGNLIIIAGRPSMGKSTLALNIADNVSKRERVAAFFSLEMGKGELEQKLISRNCQIDHKQIRDGRLSEADLQAVESYGVRSQNSSLYIMDRSGLSTAQIMAEAKALKMRKGLDLVVVDYIQLMKGYGHSREQEVASISNGLKSIAMDLQVPVIALSQLNRSLENRPNKRPVLSDLRESGAIEQDADIVAFIYRDEMYYPEPDNPRRGTAEVIVAKNRAGETGTVKMYSSRLNLSEFSPYTSRY